ncbi:unnamed protein product [Chrysoparadoxa australica]
MVLHFLCSYDMSQDPNTRGIMIKQPRKWVKKCAPLLKYSLVAIKAAIKVVGGVEVPFDAVLSAVFKEGLDLGSLVEEFETKYQGKIGADAWIVLGEVADEVGEDHEDLDATLSALKDADNKVGAALQSLVNERVQSELDAAHAFVASAAQEEDVSDTLLQAVSDKDKEEQKLRGEAYAAFWFT